MALNQPINHLLPSRPHPIHSRREPLLDSGQRERAGKKCFRTPISQIMECLYPDGGAFCVSLFDLHQHLQAL